MKNITLLFLLVLTACTSTRKSSSITPATSLVTDGKLFTSLFQQKAAEYKALCYQAYNMAHLRLNQALQSASTRPKAIITDIDETILDNSPYAVHQSLLGKDYDQNTWYDWTSRAEADTVPGAPSFLKYAASKGVQVFYITNRDEKERKGTLQNLQKFALPNADDEHLLLRQNISSKEARRQGVIANFDVVLFMGDNLSDFSALFDKKNMEERNSNARMISSDFGNKFIVLPNPDYGDWESSLYNYNYKLTLRQKDSIIKSVLKSY
jgi:5'-nucleotidase (lipoprotein e(P4) family)